MVWLVPERAVMLAAFTSSGSGMRNILALTVFLFAACATDEATTEPDVKEAPEASGWEDLVPDDVDALPELQPDPAWVIPEDVNDLPDLPSNPCVQHPVLCKIARYEHTLTKQP